MYVMVWLFSTAPKDKYVPWLLDPTVKVWLTHEGPDFISRLITDGLTFSQHALEVMKESEYEVQLGEVDHWEYVIVG